MIDFKVGNLYKVVRVFSNTVHTGNYSQVKGKPFFATDRYQRSVNVLYDSIAVCTDKEDIYVTFLGSGVDGNPVEFVVYCDDYQFFKSV